MRTCNYTNPHSGVVALLVSIWMLVMTSLVSADYTVGVGIADVTGPSAEIGFMGYANLNQKGNGVHLRQFARSFIIDDGTKGGRLAFISVDCGMIPHGVRKQVIETLSTQYEDTYSEVNLMISGSHTHSTAGGFMQDLLYDISVLGFSQQTFDALVTGISLSMRRAHEGMVSGRIYIAHGELNDANINRSPTAYLQNPEAERNLYTSDVDKTMVQLRFDGTDGKPLGVINWFAVHPTSMNNTNTLVSSDNVGFASILFEQKMNPNALPGKGGFVAAFASSNLGDVSPNIRGPKCERTGLPCDAHTSTCPEKDVCFASGPGKDMFESTKMIGERLFNKAVDLWGQTDRHQVTGALKVVHQYVDMPMSSATFFDEAADEDKTVRGCKPAMGYSFAAGTTDGPGVFSFQQGTTDDNPLWNFVRNFLAEPTAEDVECHAEKPILLATGEMVFPFEWQPRIVSTQLALLGDVAIACVPGEFTTMSGRRLRTAITESIKTQGGPDVKHVIVAGLCNTYSSYIATPEEYSVQRYEGASTIFGPSTLPLYLSQYRKLAATLVKDSALDGGPQPPDFHSKLISFIPPVIFDTAQYGHDFGDVLQQPQGVARPGDIVQTRFVAGHPRNNLAPESTFLTIERKTDSDTWFVEASDANWETKFHWDRISPVLGTSEARITWEVPEEAPGGEYRVRHFGHYKYIFGGIYPYEGVSDSFKVESNILY